MSTSAGAMQQALDMPAPELITQAEFARRVKCTRQNINKLVRKGAIDLVDGKLDYPVALQQWHDNVDGSHHERLSRDDAPAGAAIDVPADEPVVQSSEAGYKTSRAKRELHNAELVELKVKELSGQLIDAEKVKRDAFAVSRALRDAILAIPDRVAPILANESDDRRVVEILNEELGKALTGIASAIAKMSVDVSR